MGIKKRSLQQYLILYVLKIILLPIIIIGSGVITFIMLLDSGFMLPANFEESMLFEITPSIENADVFTSDLIPDMLEYIIVSKDELEIIDKGNMSERHLEKLYPQLGENTHLRGVDNAFYKEIERTDEMVIIRYSMIAQFSHPFLRLLIPYPWIANLLFWSCIFMVAVIIISRRMTAMTRIELQKLLDSAHKIGNQKLEFESEISQFKEFQIIIDALEKLKYALKNSLKEQIKQEQVQAQQIGSLAHDIKIPLTVIRGNIELLSLTELKPKQEEFAEDIHLATLQIEDYSHTLIEISRLKSSLTVIKVETNLAAFLEDLSRSFQRYSMSKGIEFSIDNHLPINTQLYIDAKLVSRALLNILHNAIEHGNGTKNIKASLLLNQNHELLIEIQDDGSGFSEEALIYGIELFYTDNKARSGTENYGMGLSFAKQVAVLHQGILTIDNTHLGGKVCFILSSNSLLKNILT